MQKKKKGAGGKLSRSEIVQARLSPKTKFAAGLVAKSELRTLSSLIESSLEHYLKFCKLDIELDGHQVNQMPMEEALNILWSSDDLIRLANVAFHMPECLSHEEGDLWGFIMDTDFFWSFYEVTIQDPMGRVLEKQWKRYHDRKGLLVGNIKEYWGQIQTLEGRKSAKIPQEHGRQIAAPPGVVTVFEGPYDQSHLYKDSDFFDKERFNIWATNITSLFRQEVDLIDEGNGNQAVSKVIYPSPEEQEEMVERLFQEKLKCQSNSTE